MRIDHKETKLYNHAVLELHGVKAVIVVRGGCEYNRFLRTNKLRARNRTLSILLSPCCVSDILDCVLLYHHRPDKVETKG
jgi:hypothetical protein